jgi:hypothetical protein
VHDEETPGIDAVPDRVGAVAERDQLRVRNHAVLDRGERSWTSLVS